MFKTYDLFNHRKVDDLVPEIVYYYLFQGLSLTAFEEKLQALPLNQPSARAFARFFFSGAMEGELDKQGRVMVPPNLREYGQLAKDVVIAGAGTRLEIWDKEVRAQYNAACQTPEEMAASMSDIGFLI